jgi:hypothetical protein
VKIPSAVSGVRSSGRMIVTNVRMRPRPVKLGRLVRLRGDAFDVLPEQEDPKALNNAGGTLMAAWVSTQPSAHLGPSASYHNTIPPGTDTF